MTCENTNPAKRLRCWVCGYAGTRRDDGSILCNAPSCGILDSRADAQRAEIERARAALRPPPDPRQAQTPG